MSKRKKFEIVSTTFDKRGYVIASAFNDYNKSHPLMKILGERVGKPENVYLHSEVLALLRSKDKTVDSIVVKRYDSKGEMTLAKPCVICQEALKMFGVKKVIYTTKNGWMEEKL